MKRALFLLPLLLASGVKADDAVPARLSLVLMLKLITYDQAFAERGSGEFVVVIPHLPGQEKELTVATEAISAIAQTRIAARALRFVPVAVDSLDDGKLAKALDAEKAGALLWLKSTPPARLAAFEKLAKERRLYTLALDSADASRALLAVEQHDGRPRPVLHLGQAKAIGASFPQSVLKIARTQQ